MNNLPEPGRPIPRVRLGTPVALPHKVDMSRRTYQPHVWEVLPPHPTVAAQPSAWGREIKFMHHYRGVVYLGYGDWNDNHGPVDVLGYDAITAEPVTLLRNVPTEAFERVREIDGWLYMPYSDPRLDNHVGGFATNEGGTWHTETCGPMVHTFDVIKWKGHLYICGSAMHDAKAPGGPLGKGIVYRRKVGAGHTWSTALEGIERAGMTRFYKLWVDEQGRLCVEEQIDPYTWRKWRTRDGVSWVPDAPAPYEYGSAGYMDRDTWVSAVPDIPFPFIPADRGRIGCVSERYMWAYDRMAVRVARTPLLL